MGCDVPAVWWSRVVYFLRIDYAKYEAAVQRRWDELDSLPWWRFGRRWRLEDELYALALLPLRHRSRASKNPDPERGKASE